MMGMYTEIYVNVNLKENTPNEVIEVLEAICAKDPTAKCLQDKPARWAFLFNNGSYYLPSTECGKLTFDEIGACYSLLGKGDLKNYDEEIEKFFAYISPWCEGEFMGYHRYEEHQAPTLAFTENTVFGDGESTLNGSLEEL